MRGSRFAAQPSETRSNGSQCHSPSQASAFVASAPWSHLRTSSPPAPSTAYSTAYSIHLLKASVLCQPLRAHPPAACRASTYYRSSSCTPSLSKHPAPAPPQSLRAGAKSGVCCDAGCVQSWLNYSCSIAAVASARGRAAHARARTHPHALVPPQASSWCQFSLHGLINFSTAHGHFRVRRACSQSRGQPEKSRSYERPSSDVQVIDFPYAEGCCQEVRSATSEEDDLMQITEPVYTPLHCTVILDRDGQG